MTGPRLTVVAGLVLALGLSGCAAAPDPATGAVLGVSLSGLMDQVDGVIARVDNATEGNVMEAAANVRSTLDNAASAWSSELGKQQSQLDTNITASLGRMQGLVNDLSSAQKELIAKAGAEALTVANTIPFANRAPQVKDYTPQFDAADGRAVQMSITGNFPEAMSDGQQPVLRAAGKVLEPNSVTTQALGFAIPPEVLPALGGQSLATLSMELEVPYKEGIVFQKVKPGKFRMLLSEVPASPVRSLIVIDSVTTRQELERKTTESPSWEVNSLKEGKDIVQKRHGVQPSAGWQIDPATSTIVKEWSKSDDRIVGPQWVIQTKSDLITETSTFACFILGGSCGSGRLSFHLTYDQVRFGDVTTQVKSGPIAISWKDTVSRSVRTPHVWTVKAVLFDGTVLELTATDRSSKYLQVDDNGHSITIRAADLSSLAR